MKNTASTFTANCRNMVQTYINLHSLESALFYADKAAVLTKEPVDIYWFAQCMFLSGQYHRASHLLQSNNLHKTHILCNYLTVKCLFEARELNEAVQVLSLLDLDLHNTSYQNDFQFFDDKLQKNQIFAAVHLLRGKVLEAMENRNKAAESYKQALQFDVYCFEAFDALIKHQMLTAQEEYELLRSLPLSQQCSKEDSELLHSLYESKLKKYQTPCGPTKTLAVLKPLPVSKLTPVTPFAVDSLIGSSYSSPTTPSMISTPNNSAALTAVTKRKSSDDGQQRPTTTATTEGADQMARLHDSFDFHVAEAERLYYNCEYGKCVELCEDVLRVDPYNCDCLLIYVSCLVALKRSNDLFSLAHKMVDLYPNRALSWYAVGCYYYVIGKNDCARRFLAKAMCLDRFFGPAWLAFGHSFAIENEHDQAMAAYFKATQLMRGCHLPRLYIGLECGLTNNVKLADRFFAQSIVIAPDDPFVMHEMGVVAFQNTHYKYAERLFREALCRVRRIFSHSMPKRWEPLLNNLGHTCRKLRKYSEALEFHNYALLLVPQSAQTYANIGYSHTLLGNTEEAIEWFHKALALKNDDSFCTTMLMYVVEQIIDERPPHEDAPEFVPNFDLQRSASKSAFSDNASEDAQSVMTSNDVSDMSMSIEVDMMDASGNKN